MTPDDLSRHIDIISDLMRTQMRIKGANLSRQVKRAGRRLPKRIRADLENIVEAEALLGNPKLMPIVDLEQIEAGISRSVAHLSNMDPGQERRDKALRLLANVSLNLIVVFVITIAVLYARGLI